MEKKLSVHIVIVTYNGMRWIERCLNTVRQSTYPVTVVVIDNGSTDGTRDFIPAHHPEVVWLPQPENLGFGQGNNVGMRYALSHQADYVLLLNQDAYLQPTAVEEMLKVADGHNLVSPLHLNGYGTRLDTMFRQSLRRADCQLLDDLLIADSPQPFYEVGQVCAACWLMPITMLREVGGFNPLFFQYGEDNNYYTRLLHHGYKVLVVPGARMWHDRNLHGNATLFNRKEISLRVLVAACDPGLTFWRRVRKWVGIGIGAPRATCVALLKLIPQMPSIAKSRREEKKRQSCWL